MVPSSEQTSSQRTSWQRRFQQPRFRLRRSPSRPALPAGLGRALALALWAVVLLQSSLDGRLDLLLRRVFHPLVAAAGLVLLTLALLQGLVAWRGERGAGTAPPEGHRERRRDTAMSLLTAAIAALLIAVPPNPSFADLASQRPGDDTASDTLSFVLPPAQRSLTDWVRLLRSQPDPELYEGDPVQISGFVLPVSGQPPQLARLLVRCCLADATPVGLPVRWPAGQPLPRADQWLAIEGHMAVEPLARRSPASGKAAGMHGELAGAQLVVVPARIRPIPRPARPLEP